MTLFVVRIFVLGCAGVAALASLLLANWMWLTHSDGLQWLWNAFAGVFVVCYLVYLALRWWEDR